MKIYTKGGDGGFSTLSSPMKISKADERFDVLGSIDELTSNLGLCRAIATCPVLIGRIERVQKLLINLMAGIVFPNDQKYEVPQGEIDFLEEVIDKVESSFERVKEFVVPGGCELSARLDVARTVCRRAERALSVMSKKYPVKANVRIYLNRLSDFLYMAARYADYENASGGVNHFSGSAKDEQGKTQIDSQKVVEEVVKIMSSGTEMTLEKAKTLSEGIRKHAKEVGLNAVIAVCNSQGRPVSVEVMDGAYLVSFDVAVKKAYTSVAVKMSTDELCRQVEKGGALYGLKGEPQIICLGGGEPLKNGSVIVGGVGVSGGTAEQDSELALYGAKLFEKLFG